MAVVRAAVRADLPAVADFLRPRLHGRGGPADFRRILKFGWLADEPNIGFLVEHDGRVRGFVGGIYSRREIRGQMHSFCNVHGFAVDEEFRTHSLSIMKRLLDRPDHTYTCFSPSPVAVEIFKFFKFHVVDTTKVVYTPAAALSGLARSGVRLYRGSSLADKVDGVQRTIMRDHDGYGCGHFLLEAKGERCYFVTIRRGYDVRAYVDVLHASNPALLAANIPSIYLPVCLTHRTPLVALDRRFVPQPPAGSFTYSRVRPLLFRSAALKVSDIDMLYSELVPIYA